MKKFIYSTLVLFAGLSAASCQQEELAIYDPGKVKAPTLGAVSGSTLKADGADIMIDFGKADFGVTVSDTYTLYAAASESFDKAEKVSAAISAGKISVKQSVLNSTILNLDGQIGEPFTLYLRLSSYITNDKTSAISKTESHSNVVSASFTPYNQAVLDKDTYEHIWVQGQYCDWSHDKSQFLYNYSKDGVKYTGVIDFADKASDGIKFTGVGAWEDDTNWGSVDSGEAAEAGTIQLITGGASKNIVCYSKRFYMFSFNRKTLVLTKEWGANSIGIVGSINDWGNAGPDIKMNFNKDYVRFWADIEITKEEEVKFRADSDWANNWGAGAIGGGDNIKLGPGKYRAYLDINKGIVEFNEKMFGKDEPSADGK